jgi:hypothetical protein
MTTNVMLSGGLLSLSPTTTKKQVIEDAKQLIIEVVDGGEIDKLELMSKVCRAKEFINTLDTELRSKLDIYQKTTAFGMELTPVNGGETINYSEDPIYQQLKADLDARAELLKLAQKQDLIDGYGNDVPKVSTTPRKSSITIKF